jgi:hypothetical protein
MSVGLARYKPGAARHCLATGCLPLAMGRHGPNRAPNATEGTEAAAARATGRQSPPEHVSTPPGGGDRRRAGRYE